MDRTKKLKLNAITSLINRLVRIVSGLILPRLILLYFGSATNGLVASIRQFLSIITFLDLGVGSVVQSALYRPLARKDEKQISAVLAAARNYFQKIAYILVVYVGALIVFYPLFLDSMFGYLPTVFLVLALSISLFGQYYFGIVNELLLNANQQSYIQYASEIIVVILNVVISVVLITQGASIQIVQLGAGLVFLIRPVFLSWYVNRNFNINYDIEVKEDPLPQRWSGMGQHIAYTIQKSTDIVTLTLFSSLEYVSIYTVYNLVVEAISMLVSSLTTGMGSFFGSLLADEEMELLDKYFNRIEWIVHTGVSYLYAMTAVLITPFVMVYTSGVEDIDYYAPIFAVFIVLSKAAYSMRTPYQVMVFSAGHFKQTQVSSFIEAGINIVISILLVSRYGLIGVAIGTLVSMMYRLTYLVLYLSKNILHRPVRFFMKHILVDISFFALVLSMGTLMSSFYEIQSLIDWVIVAVVLGIVSLVLLFGLNYVAYREEMLSVLQTIKKRK